MAFIRSLLFNIVFYAYTAFICLFLAFSFLLPRKGAYRFVKFFYFEAIAVIERLFLGLRFRVTGRENIPEGSYILALKHYSAYETLKLPVIFGDIAIILKKELSWIPFWGWYTLKLGMIPVDRGGRQKALSSLIKGGKRVIEQGRPILIFPQGTRVQPHETTAEKPYKVGIAKIAETLNLPVVPVALNSGAFWPKHSFIKKGGTVDFKILPIIPAGLPAVDVLKRLEEVLEPESARLIENADIQPTRISGWIKFFAFLFLVWFAYWQLVAFTIRDRLSFVPDSITSLYKPSIDGFPGAIHISWPQVTFTGDNGTMTLPIAEARLWPLPTGDVTVYANQGVRIETTREGNAVEINADRFSMTFALPAMWLPQDQWNMTLKNIDAAVNGATISGEGDIAMPLAEAPINGEMQLRVTNHAGILALIVDNGLLEKDKAGLAMAFMDAMPTTNGAISVPFAVRDDVIYLSVLRVFNLADLRPQADAPGLQPQRTHSDGSGTNSPQAPVPQTPAPGQPTGQ